VSRTLPLCDQLAVLLERTYDTAHSLVPLGRFVVGECGLELIHRRAAPRQRVDHQGDGARLILSGGSDAWTAALYLPAPMIRHLEEHDPCRGIDDENVDAFTTLVEEIDHLVTFADRVCHAGADVSLLELEWHAAVSQYLVLTHFIGRLSGRDEITAAERAFVEHHVFHKRRFAEPDAQLNARYAEATRLSVRFVRHLSRLPRSARLARLRRFHRASHQEKLSRFA
jgi:hypothetical protein